MRNYISIGPVSLRLSRKGIAPWGYPRLVIGGLSMLSRDSGGGLTLASYHPRRSTTWFWSVSITKRQANRWIARDTRRTGQWHDYYRLPFGRSFVIARQDWHRERRP